MAKTPVFNIGDKVAYSAQFLRSIGMSHSDMARGRGVVQETKLHCPGFCTVKIAWDRDLPETVRDCNLAKVGLNTRFSSC